MTIADSKDGVGEVWEDFVVIRVQADGRVARNSAALVRRLCRQTNAGVIALLNMPESFVQALKVEGRLAGFQVVLPRSNPFVGAGPSGSFGLLIRPQIIRSRSFDLAVPPSPERPGLDLVIRSHGGDMRLLLAELPWPDLLMGPGRGRLRGVLDRQPGLPALVIGTVPTALYLRFMTSLVQAGGKTTHRRRLVRLRGLRLRYAVIGVNNLHVYAMPEGNLCTAEALSGGRVARFRVDRTR